MDGNDHDDSIPPDKNQSISGFSDIVFAEECSQGLDSQDRDFYALSPLPATLDIPPHLIIGEATNKRTKTSSNSQAQVESSLECDAAMILSPNIDRDCYSNSVSNKRTRSTESINEIGIEETDETVLDHMNRVKKPHKEHYRSNHQIGPNQSIRNHHDHEISIDEDQDNHASMSQTPVISEKHLKFTNNLKTANRASKDMDNHTIHSMNSGKVLIITPEVPLSTVMKSPKQFQAALKSSKLKDIHIKDIRPNYKRGIIALELINNDDIQNYELTKVKEIGNWQVKCSVPISDKLSFGVISPIDPEEEIEVTDIEVPNNVRVLSVERMNRTIDNGRKTPSTCIKVTFDSPILPSNIRIHLFNFRVRPFTPAPLQCFRCQRLGHTIGGCKANHPKCLFCSGPHSIKEDKCETSIPNCANCNQNHKANSYQCSYLQEGYRLDRERNLSKTTKTNRFYNSNQSSITISNKEAPSMKVINHEAEIHHSLNSQVPPKTYASTLANSPPINHKKIKETKPTQILKDVAVQTDDLKEQTRKDQHKTDYAKKMEINGIFECLVELFCSNIFQESVAVRRNLIKSAIQHSFGMDIIDNQVESEVEEEGQKTDGVLSDVNSNYHTNKEKRKVKQSSNLDDKSSQSQSAEGTRNSRRSKRQVRRKDKFK